MSTSVTLLLLHYLILQPIKQQQSLNAWHFFKYQKITQINLHLLYKFTLSFALKSGSKSQLTTLGTFIRRTYKKVSSIQ